MRVISCAYIQMAVVQQQLVHPGPGFGPAGFQSSSAGRTSAPDLLVFFSSYSDILEGFVWGLGLGFIILCTFWCYDVDVTASGVGDFELRLDFRDETIHPIPYPQYWAHSFC